MSAGPQGIAATCQRLNHRPVVRCAATCRGRLRLDRTREANRLITALSARADALSDTEKEG